MSFDIEKGQKTRGIKKIPDTKKVKTLGSDEALARQLAVSSNNNIIYVLIVRLNKI